MFDGSGVLAALKQCGITHVVWLPDSDLGRWDHALSSDPNLQLIRACREGEAISIAGGLLLGGRQPIVLIQCTGLFEAGDSLRNFCFDLELPLFLLVGVRNWKAHQQGKTRDSCPRFIEPYVKAWRLDYVWLDDRHTPADLAKAYQEARAANRPRIALYAE